MKLKFPQSKFGAFLVGVYFLLLLVVIEEFLSGPIIEMAGLGMGIFTLPSSLLVFGIAKGVSPTPLGGDWVFFVLFLMSWGMDALSTRVPAWASRSVAR